MKRIFYYFPLTHTHTHTIILSAGRRKFQFKTSSLSPPTGFIGTIRPVNTRATVTVIVYYTTCIYVILFLFYFIPTVHDMNRTKPLGCIVYKFRKMPRSYFRRQRVWFVVGTLQKHSAADDPVRSYPKQTVTIKCRISFVFRFTLEELEGRERNKWIKLCFRSTNNNHSLTCCGVDKIDDIISTAWKRDLVEC